LSLSVNIFLNVTKFDIVLDDVDVGVSHNSADFSDIVRFDFKVTVSTGHGFT